ncbi:MAG: hypothetical protein Q9157_002922 [Trypethelium eluteriae]
MGSKERAPIIVLVLGKTGVGKSTFIKAATGLDVEVGDTLKSCTHEVQIYPVRESRIFLIDTPGFDDPARSDTDILQSIASCLADLHEGLIFDSEAVNLSGIVYIHSINDVRMTGSMLQNLRVFRHLVGKSNMEKCAMVTTKWSLENADTAGKREVELIEKETCWRNDLQNGATIRRFEDTRESALEAIRSVTATGVFTPQLVQEYIIEGRALQDTAAGRALDEDLASARKKHQAELATMRSEYNRAFAAKDADTAAQIRVLSERREAKLKEMDNDLEQLRATRDEAQKRIDELESLAAASIISIDPAELKSDRRRRRQKRAFRWFGRFAAFGGAVTMTILSHGVMAPVGLGLITGVEAIFQEQKNRDAAEKLAREQFRK